jgi:hypothetical protein
MVRFSFGAELKACFFDLAEPLFFTFSQVDCSRRVGERFEVGVALIGSLALPILLRCLAPTISMRTPPELHKGSSPPFFESLRLPPKKVTAAVRRLLAATVYDIA